MDQEIVNPGAIVGETMSLVKDACQKDFGHCPLRG
jgi:hypothetical protein